MRLFVYVAAVLALSAVSVLSQTVTTVNPAGQTVVEVITVDPNLGLPTTQTLQTLTTTATTQTTPPPPPTTTTTTQAQGNQGPVGQPQTAAAGPTIYTYTTTDANGNTEAVVATFTPSFGPTTGGSITAGPGTILNYSSWRSSVGSNTVAVVSAGIARWSVQPRWMSIGVALCAGMTGGAWLALA
ncbi:hypothetical protein GSI_05428 [Ganoderma sinense ZZ0214-1]|uniref:Transporter n=1 Tax=Ganoderma sinense ZZ0214-1 TaxID=1077348 RepID=A0A2G8SEL0_9APHY|nr:hypothetical protein GSI_05428 [Ganoderma sinense ZZ0214-1]